MNDHGPAQTILLILGIIVLVKSIWGIAHPSSMKSTANWWARAIPRVNTLCAIVYIVIAAGCWIAVLLDQPLTNWLLAAFGALFAWAGTIYLKPQELTKLIKRMAGDRSLAAIRIISVVSALIALFLITVAYKGA